MATMNISLPDAMRDWVESQSKQDAITKGLESGEPKPFDKAAFKQRMQDSI